MGAGRLLGKDRRGEVVCIWLRKNVLQRNDDSRRAWGMNVPEWDRVCSKSTGIASVFKMHVVSMGRR